MVHIHLLSTNNNCKWCVRVPLCVDRDTRINLNIVIGMPNKSKKIFDGIQLQLRIISAKKWNSFIAIFTLLRFLWILN